MDFTIAKAALYATITSQAFDKPANSEYCAHPAAGSWLMCIGYSLAAPKYASAVLMETLSQQPCHVDMQ